MMKQVSAAVAFLCGEWFCKSMMKISKDMSQKLWHVVRICLELCTWDNPKIPKEVSKIAHAFTINFSWKRSNALCHAVFFSEHLGATFGRNRTELGWLKLALLGTIAGGAGAFVLHWVGLVDMSWEWQTPRMQSLEKNHHQAFLVWQETAMKNLGKDFFCIKHLGDGSFPFHQDAGKSPPRKNAVYWITP